MVKESKKCSKCGQYGHNLRTCYGKTTLKLFGVTIVPNEDDDLIRKTKSMGNLAACTNAEQNPTIIAIDDVGYATDQPGTDHKTQERRKGVTWNVAEHKAFLKGLEKHGKGDWRSIAKNFVTSRTPTQVASHAQKHFIRQNKGSDKKKRSSLFDMSFQDATTLNCPPPPPPPPEPPRRPPPQFPPHAENSSVGSSNNTLDVQRQALIPVDAAGNFSMPAPYGFPSFGPMPHFSMVGGSSNGQNFGEVYPRPTISFIPVMNFPNHGSICLSNTSLANYPLKLY